MFLFFYVINMSVFTFHIRYISIYALYWHNRFIFHHMYYDWYCKADSSAQDFISVLSVLLSESDYQPANLCWKMGNATGVPAAVCNFSVRWLFMVPQKKKIHYNFFFLMHVHVCLCQIFFCYYQSQGNDPVNKRMFL